MIRALLTIGCLGLLAVAGMLAYQRFGSALLNLEPQAQGLPPVLDPLANRPPASETARPQPGPALAGGGAGVVARPPTGEDARGAAPTPPAGELPPDVTVGKRTHVVQAGETLWDLSRYYYGSPAHVERIADANGMDAPKRLRPGMVLFLPEIAGVKIADPPPSQRPRTELTGPASPAPPFEPMPPTLSRETKTEP